MKIVFAGSPEYAVPSLEKLVKAGERVVAVITQPDKPAGRKRTLTPTPVKAFALETGLPVYDFNKIREHVKEVESLDADIMITCAYGQILPQSILNCFKGGVWNLHASLLPELRGASPIQSAILEGKTHTGVTVMRTEADLDTGDMLLVKRLEIGDMTCGELSKKLSLLSAEAALEAVRLISKGETQLLMQDEAKATYCKKIDKADAKINFRDGAEKVFRAIKAFSPEPAAWCKQGEILLNVYDCARADGAGRAGEVICADKRGIAVACGNGAVLLTVIQPAGGKVMNAADYVNGRKIKVGDMLG